MKKLYFLILSMPFISLSQTTYYKYAPRDASSQVNYAKVGEDLNNTLKNVVEQREAQARALGWSSAAEMNAARKEEKNRIKIEKSLEREEKKRIKSEAKAIKREEDLEKEKAKAIEKQKKIN